MNDILTGTRVRAAGAKALARHLKDSIAGGQLHAGMRLPPERELCRRFGASRGSVRRVLAELRELGLIVQAVGSGTFVAEGVGSGAAAAGRMAGLQTSPAELMQARLLIEPLMPTLIVRNATSADFARMALCLARSEAASSIEEFEQWDGELHKAFAQATHNTFFLQIMELANQVREQGEWGRLKRESLTAARRGQYQLQHRAIVAALKDRDAGQARVLLHAHLEQIQQNLFGG